MSESAPAPLVPPDLDLRDFAFMPIDVRRLLTSETWLTANGDEKAAAMTLWLESWHQVPAGSLPDHDRMLAVLSQAGAKWRRVRSAALRGWLKCSDGRLYHPVVTEKAIEAWGRKTAQRQRTKAARQARLNRTATTPVTDDATGHATGDVTRSVTDDVTGSKGQGQGQGTAQQSSSPPGEAAPPAPGRRKAELDGLEERLRTAANLENDPSPALLDLSPILTLIDRGYDLDRDIEPVLRAAAAGRKRGRTWRYYVPGIEAARSGNDAIRPAPAGGNGARQPVDWGLAVAAYERLGGEFLEGTGPGQWGYRADLPPEVAAEFDAADERLAAARRERLAAIIE